MLYFPGTRASALPLLHVQGGVHVPRPGIVLSNNPADQLVGGQGNPEGADEGGTTLEGAWQGCAGHRPTQLGRPDVRPAVAGVEGAAPYHAPWHHGPFFIDLFPQRCQMVS